METLNARNVALNTRLTNGFECLIVNDDALNAKLWRDGGSECLTANNGSECQTVNVDSKHQTKDTTLNAKLNNGSECQTKNTTLNVKLKHEDVALNAELKEIWWI
uniref:Uncharacterized protein n=1 Tax=Vitis vinifera TaxID=29760 RepID=A5C4X2_VITVI|nr:hypothetical protein VITISV_006005 [Vitis vinifera]